MATHDYVISNGTGSAVRSDINGALAAIVSQNSNASAPATTYAYMSWADTSAGVMKMRNGANSAWISLYELDGTFLASDISLAAGSAAAPSLFFTGDTNTGLFSPGADTVALATAGSNRLHITSGGLVGIGTTGPSQALHVVSSIQQVLLEGATQGAIEIKKSGTNGYGIVSDGAGLLKFYDYNGTTYRLVIDSSGRVGIGTTSPSEKLHVSGGNVLLQQGNYFIIPDGGGNYGAGNGSYIGNSGQNLQIQMRNSGDGVISFSIGATEAARIDTSRRLLVGTSTTASVGGINAQHAFFHGTSSQWAATVQHTTGAGNSPFGLAIKYTAATPNNASSDFVWCEDATAIRARIYSNGGLANYSANNANLSDRNAKKDISIAADTWSCVKEWEIVNYRYKDQPDDADLNLGVIAQQVAESCPEVITIFQEAKDDQPEKLGVKEQQMYWMAIKALQEAMERIETLEASNADMLARVTALEGN